MAPTVPTAPTGKASDESVEVRLDGDELERAWKVSIYRVPDVGAAELGQVVRLLAVQFGMTAEESRALLRSCPASVPQMMSQEDAEGLVVALRAFRVGARCECVTLRMRCRCDFHPQFLNRGTCLHCGSWVCDVCVSGTGKQICEACHGSWRRRRTRRRVRISILLLILAFVSVWAWMRQERRAERTQWERTIQVAVVILVDGEVDAPVLTALVSGLRRLDDQLETEFGSFHERTVVPFRFEAVGPMSVEESVPELPMVPSVWDVIEYTWFQNRFMQKVNDRIGLSPADFDSRIYLVARPARTSGSDRFVEGIAEWGGETGIVQITLEMDTVDNALIAAAHEAMHTLGATDKYEGQGRTLAPQGFAEPGRDPLYPQRWLEIMAKEIPVTASTGRLPNSVSEMRVGAMTAVEIGWVKKGAPEAN
jgi:hypothetical protein